MTGNSWMLGNPYKKHPSKEGRRHAFEKQCTVLQLMKSRWQLYEKN